MSTLAWLIQLSKQASLCIPDLAKSFCTVLVAVGVKTPEGEKHMSRSGNAQTYC